MVKVVNILVTNGYRKCTLSINGRPRHDARASEGRAGGRVARACPCPISNRIMKSKMKLFGNV